MVEFWAGLGIPVRCVDRSDEQAIDRGFEIAGLLIGVVAWQLQAGQYGRPTREDRYAIPAFLAAPYCMIPRLPDCFRRKVDIRRLEFLKANNVGFCSAKPVKEVRQTAIDVVDIETGEFQWRFRQKRVLNAIPRCGRGPIEAKLHGRKTR